MYRMLVVDDEPIIVDWLYELLTGLPELEMEVYKAYSGSEALNTLKSAKVDIVLADIRMPGINGLQLLNEINERWPECRVIFLTGYDDFEYIYTAVNKNIDGYILKTEDDDEIINAVMKTTAKIKKNLTLEELVCKAEQQMKKALPVLQKEYLTGLLSGSRYPKDMEYDKLAELNISLHMDQPLLFVVGSISMLKSSYSSVEKAQAFYSVAAVADRYFAGYLKYANVIYDDFTAVWMMQPDENREGQEAGSVSKDWSHLLSFVRGTLETVQAVCRNTLEITISFAVSSEPVPWDSIAERFSSLRLITSYNIGMKLEAIVTDKSPADAGALRFSESNPSVHQALKHIKKLDLMQSCLERGQKEEFMALLSPVIEFFRESAGASLSSLYELYYSIALLFLTYINKTNIADKLSARINLSNLMNLNKLSSWSEAAGFLYSLSAALFEVQNQEHEIRSMAIITYIRQYIAAHLGDDLSLLKLADLVYMNPSYFSRLFKQAAGSNLSNYIQEMRINKAKHMLENGNNKIVDVAEAVGFNTTNNFTRFFRKITGLTPQEYREHLIKSR